jgi:hypothetical protein
MDGARRVPGPDLIQLGSPMGVKGIAVTCPEYAGLPSEDLGWIDAESATGEQHAQSLAACRAPIASMAPAVSSSL